MKKKKRPGYWLVLAFFILLLALGALLLVFAPREPFSFLTGPRMTV